MATFLDRVVLAKESTKKRLHCKCLECFSAVDDLVRQLTAGQSTINSYNNLFGTAVALPSSSTFIAVSADQHQYYGHNQPLQQSSMVYYNCPAGLQSGQNIDLSVAWQPSTVNFPTTDLRNVLCDQYETEHFDDGIGDNDESNSAAEEPAVAPTPPEPEPDIAEIRKLFKRKRPPTLDPTPIRRSTRVSIKRDLHPECLTDDDFDDADEDYDIDEEEDADFQLPEHSLEKLNERADCKWNNFDEEDYLGQFVTLRLNCMIPGCDEEVDDKAQMKEHLLVKHGQKKAKCVAAGCGVEIGSKLTEHLTTMHANQVEWPCETCSRNCTSYRALADHIHRLHEKGLFACNFTNCTFTTRVNRQRVKKHHIKHNTGTHKCHWPGCSKAFQRGCYLKNHLRVHTGEKPFACEICNQTFTQKVSLNMHYKTITHRNNAAKVSG